MMRQRGAGAGAGRRAVGGQLKRVTAGEGICPAGIRRF